jgi:hypothetical protein
MTGKSVSETHSPAGESQPRLHQHGHEVRPVLDRWLERREEGQAYG